MATLIIRQLLFQDYTLSAAGKQDRQHRCISIFQVSRSAYYRSITFGRHAIP